MINFTVTLTQTDHHLVVVRICHITAKVQSVKISEVETFLTFIGDYTGALSIKPLVLTDPKLAQYVWNKALKLS